MLLRYINNAFIILSILISQSALGLGYTPLELYLDNPPTYRWCDIKYNSGYNTWFIKHYSMDHAPNIIVIYDISDLVKVKQCNQPYRGYDPELVGP